MESPIWKPPPFCALLYHSILGAWVVKAQTDLSANSTKVCRWTRLLCKIKPNHYGTSYTKIKTETAGSNAVNHHHPKALIRTGRSRPCPCSGQLSAVSCAPLGKGTSYHSEALQSPRHTILKLSFHFNPSFYPSCQHTSSTHQDNFRNMNSVNLICY